MSHSYLDLAAISTGSAAGGGKVAALELASDIVRRWQLGERPDAEAALAKHQELREHSIIILDLAYQEFLARCRRNESPDVEAFCQRFPEVADSLGEMLRLELLAESAPEIQAELTSTVWPESGESFLGFSLIVEIGRGAFGRVFLASEPLLGDRVVAVKIGRHTASEARTLGRLRHPNIVPVYSVRQDQDSGLTALCMPFLGSATLEDVLTRSISRPHMPDRSDVIVEIISAGDLPAQAGGKFSPPPRALKKGSYVDGVLHLITQLADALAFVHSVGICHRDLKPSNVLVSPDGRAMLLDFDLSHDENCVHNRQGGTLPYMSPEQLLATEYEDRRSSPLLDGRSDLFSLGVILHRLLTGEHPFGPLPEDGDDVGLRTLLLQRQRAGAAYARLANPAIDAPLARLVQRCLAYNPNDRPTSAAALAAELRKASRVPRRLRRWARKRPALAAGLLVAALGASTAGSYAWAVRPSYLERQFQGAVAAYQLGDYETALTHLNHVLDANPRSTSALVARGRVYLRMGEHDPIKLNQSLRDFETARKMAPDARLEAAIGYVFHLQQKPDVTIGGYQKALRAGFRSAPLLNNLGEMYKRVSQFEDACQVLKEAVELDPSLQIAHWNLALAYRQKLLQLRSQMHSRSTTQPNGIQLEWTQTADKAINSIQRAFETGPSNPWLHRDAALIDALAGNRDDAAIEHLCQAVLEGLSPAEFRSNPAFKKLLSKTNLPGSRHPADGTPPAIPMLIDPVSADLDSMISPH